VPIVAAIADTHMPRGSRRLPQECLRLLGRADLILHLGDVVAESVLTELREIAPVGAVRGNADLPELQAKLPERLVVEVGGARLGLVHVPGPKAGRETRLLRALPGCDAIVFGHTHRPEAYRHAGVWLLNPGSPTERRRAACRSMLLLTIRDGLVTPELVELP
jgi:putative phosphoesterase